MPERTLRLRASIETTSTGKMSFSCTAEGEGFLRDELLVELDELVRELKERTKPTQVEEREKK